MTSEQSWVLCHVVHLFLEVLHTISSLDVVRELIPKAWCIGTECSVTKPFQISEIYLESLPVYVHIPQSSFASSRLFLFFVAKYSWDCILLQSLFLVQTQFMFSVLI